MNDNICQRDLFNRALLALHNDYITHPNRVGESNLEPSEHIGQHPLCSDTSNQGDDAGRSQHRPHSGTRFWKRQRNRDSPKNAEENL